MINKLTNELIDKIILQLSSEELKKKLSCGILDPIICNINDKIYPYILTIFLMYILILILIICILIILISKKKNI